MTTYQTYGGKTDWSFLTKHGVTEEEAEGLYRKHLGREINEARYRALQRAREEAVNIGYSRMTILQKLLYRWQWMVKHYA